jgi:O-ureido-D-serine cyclo-ligase
MPRTFSVGTWTARAHVLRLLDAGRTVMVQPYQSAVDTQGEVGLVLFGGEFSHAMAKGPLLRPGAGIRGNLWEHEKIDAIVPTDLQRATAHAALAAAEHLLRPTTYARVDLVSSADGSPAVLELELLDPALFFENQPSAATRFAQVLRERMP